MERIEELLMDMIDDGPLDESAAPIDASSVPIDAELSSELQRIHAQSPLLAQCIEHPSDNVLEALNKQRASLHTTLFRLPYSIGAAARWGGGVVAVACVLQLATSFLAPDQAFVSIARSPIQQSQPAIEQPVRHIDEGMRLIPLSPSSHTTTSTIESHIERTALLKRRNEIREQLARTTDPEARVQLERDLERVNELVK